MFSGFNYFVVIFIICTGIYIICTSKDYIKRLFGMAIFQVAVLLFYISIGFIDNSHIPIIEDNINLYTNPIPHVLMLTAIVVGVATLSVGLSLVIRIKNISNNVDDETAL